MAESETTSSTYRTIRFEPEHNNRVLLHDIDRGAAVSVRTQGYESQIDSALADLVSGNLIEATITGDREDRNSWEFDSLDVVSDQTLFLQHDIDSSVLSAPVHSVWDDRDEDRGLAWDSLTVSDSGELLAELQLFSNQRPDIELWRSMLEGYFDFEPWFSGDALFSRNEGIHDLIVVNTSDTDFVVLFAFPEGSPSLEELRAEVEKNPVEV